MLLLDTFHVSYCTNIHPGEDWAATMESLVTYLPKIKSQVSNHQPFGIGLRLSNTASEELNQPKVLQDFKDWLQENDLYVFTMNGFPYGNFHNQIIKEEVHTPDWTTIQRLQYTKRLCSQLAYLLPDHVKSGGISTSPIGYKHKFEGIDQRKKACQTGAVHIVDVLMHLIEIEKLTQKHIHLDIEPEPDGLLENSEDFITFFENHLFPTAVPKLKKILDLNSKEAKTLVCRHITLCYDVCHFSLAFEAPEVTFKKLSASGINIGKIQVSAALKVTYRQQWEGQFDTLKMFDEPTYLHQVTQKVADTVVTYRDLPEFFTQKPKFDEIRVHFHVPIYQKNFELLESTQSAIIEVLQYVKKNTVCDHLEVETYTWKVLPSKLKVDIADSIVKELFWLKNQLTEQQKC